MCETVCYFRKIVIFLMPQNLHWASESIRKYCICYFFIWELQYNYVTINLSKIEIIFVYILLLLVILVFKLTSAWSFVVVIVRDKTSKQNGCNFIRLLFSVTIVGKPTSLTLQSI